MIIIAVVIIRRVTPLSVLLVVGLLGRRWIWFAAV
jgi:hypothetical protein